MPDFPVWPECNIGCVFCSNPTTGFRNTAHKYSLENLRKKVMDYKDGFRRFLKFDEVDDCFTLTGGEPTLHPDFLQVLAMVRGEFPKSTIRMLTNGRMFAYEDFTRRVMGVAQTPFELAIPLFGYDPKTHEAISRAPKSFEQTMAGLRFVERHRLPGQKVEIRVILNRIQVRWLDGLLDFILRELPWIESVVFLFVELEGFAERHRDVLQMTFSECAAHLDRNYEKLRMFRDTRIYHFPLCSLPTRLWPFVYNTLSPIKVHFPQQCGQCLYRGQCVGVHRSYEKYVGAPDIRPILEPRSVLVRNDRYRPIEAVSKEREGSRPGVWLDGSGEDSSSAVRWAGLAGVSGWVDRTPGLGKREVERLRESLRTAFSGGGGGILSVGRAALSDLPSEKNPLDPGFLLRVSGAQGPEALRGIFSDGGGVHATGMIPVERQAEALEAYICALEERRSKGKSLSSPYFFIELSPVGIDAAVDSLVKARIRSAGSESAAAAYRLLLGQIGPALCHWAYHQLRISLNGRRFLELEAAGARRPEMVWALAGLSPEQALEYAAKIPRGIFQLGVKQVGVIERLLKQPPMTCDSTGSRRWIDKLANYQIDLNRIVPGGGYEAQDRRRQGAGKNLDPQGAA